MSITLAHYLVLSAILFATSVIGIFLNRKNVIVLLMAIELMLLAVNMNFVAFLMGAVIVLELSIVIIRSFIGTNAPVQPMPEEVMAKNTQALGMLIFVDYVYAFEVAGVILLVAIIAAVALTLRNRKDSKSQNIHEQVNVVAADRMRIVKMGSDMAAKQDTRGEKK